MKLRPSRLWLVGLLASLINANVSSVSATSIRDVQILTAKSGSTTVSIPRQVMSGQRMQVVITSTVGAHIAVTLQFSDQHTIHLSKTIGITGSAQFEPLVMYQPQGVDTIAVIVRASRRRLNDVVHGTISLLEHVVLSGTVKVPTQVVQGHIMPITVTTSQPDVSVAATLAYPDGRVEPLGAGTSNGNGRWITSVQLSANDGKGRIRVVALLSVPGARRRLMAFTRLVPALG